MLDEPLWGWPTDSPQRLDALLKISRLGTTILLVEQNAKLALKIAN